MIKKENIEKYYNIYEKRKCVDFYLTNGLCFQVIRDFIRFEAEDTNHTTFEFDVIGNERDFTNKEKEDIMNLYYNDELEEYLEDF